MSLTQLWKDSRYQVENKQLQQIIAFAGEGKLRDGSITSVEFRDFLSIIPSETLKQYANSCLSDSFPGSGLALQDIVNQIGIRLGFEVENGFYQGSQNNIGNDGLWKLPGGHCVVVEVKTTDAYRIDSNKIAEYRKRLVANQKIVEESSSILIVVGRQDTGDLEAQIRGSRHAWDIRLISVESLLKLMLLKENVDDPQIIQRICEILIPKEFTRLDNIIDIVFLTTEEAKQDSEEETFGEGFEISDSEQIKPDHRWADFNELCVEKFSKRKDIDLIRQTKTKYQSTNKKVRVVCSVSRDYTTLKGNTNETNGSFWSGFRLHQKEFLDGAESGYFLLGCGSAEDILVIESGEINKWLDELNVSAKDTFSHWHLHVFLENGKYFLEKKKGKGRLDITKYKM